MVRQAFELEEQILLFVQDHMRTPLLTPVMKGITLLGDMGAVWIVISMGLCLSKRWRKTGVTGLCAIGLSVMINNVFLKNLIGRARPFDVIQNLVPLITKPTDYSFPSGHTACSFAVAFLLLRKLPKKYGIPCLILAGLIGFSRIYLGVHYMSDVLAGAVSGIVLSYVADYLVYTAEQTKEVIHESRHHN